MANPTAADRAEIKAAARRIVRRRDLPQTRNPAKYTWRDDEGTAQNTRLSKRDRQILEALLEGPIYCASPLRISDSVLRLRRDHGLPVKTEVFSERDGEEALTFGVYRVTGQVEREDA